MALLILSKPIALRRHFLLPLLGAPLAAVVLKSMLRVFRAVSSCFVFVSVTDSHIHDFLLSE